jgi:pilus assembly protein CpaB
VARMQGLALPSGNRALLAIAALAGLAAAVLFVVAVNNGDSKSSTGTDVGAGGNTIVAAKTIPAGTKIEAEMVTATKVPGELVPANGFTDTSQVIGQVTKYEITEKDQITSSKIAPIANGQGLRYVLNDGRQAVGLQVKEGTAVGGLLAPGDRVNVIGTFKIKDPSLTGGRYILRTQTILQNVEVLSVGQEHQEPLPAGSSGDASSGVTGQVPADVKQQPGASTITLAVNPEDAQILISAQERAKTVWTSLRPAGDNDKHEIAPYDEIVYE